MITALLEDLTTPLLPLLTEQKQVTLTWQTATGEEKELCCRLTSPTREGLRQALLYLLTHPTLSAPVLVMHIALTSLPTYQPFRYRACLTRPHHPLPERRFTWQSG